MRKQVAVLAAIVLCIGSLLAGNWRMTAEAAPSMDTFSGEIKLLKQENGNYVMQVTVGNDGPDFTGTVQAVFLGNDDGNCAYNTEITLPSQGKKQFTITVTEQAINEMRDVGALNFLDEKGKLLQTISLSNILGKNAAGITVGILSDQYSDLTYLDAGGRLLGFQSGAYPFQLVEVNQENLKGYLEGLYFLVIDNYNVSSLAKEDIEAIQDWVIDGGWLMIGTGAYAEQTLSGFTEDFLEVEVAGISEPGESNQISIEAEKYGNFYNYHSVGIDFSAMAIADLTYDRSGMFYDSREHPGIYASIGDGAMSILFYSLGEKELQKLENYMVQGLFTDIMYRSVSYQDFGGYSEEERVGKRALAFIDNCNTNVDFKGLEVLIGIYVIIIGPIVYLVLRKCKKSEWYWVLAPGMGVLFIVGVYFFGQGAQVRETNVYSVTVQRVDSNRADTYLLAYHSGVKEWNIRLQDGYEVAGPGLTDYYRSYSSNSSDYYYAVSKNSEGLFVGIKPRENFDSGFLYAGKKAENKGSISGADIWVSGVTGKTKGTVTNDTACDLAYMAVQTKAYLMVFSDVKAGETLDLEQAVKDGRCVYQNDVKYFDNLLYDMVGIYGRQPGVTYEQDDIAALLVGISISQKSRPLDGEYAAIVGVVRDYEKAIASKCNEISYGCLYSFVEAEVEGNAAD
ncbi:MAG: hypothetical protein HFH82_16440 [Lachnospiraceae bacterium]|nr:hypothetical protein [Lachnospiraceae bacterium]